MNNTDKQLTIFLMKELNNISLDITCNNLDDWYKRGVSFESNFEKVCMLYRLWDTVTYSTDKKELLESRINGISFLFCIEIIIHTLNDIRIYTTYKRMVERNELTPDNLQTMMNELKSRYSVNKSFVSKTVGRFLKLSSKCYDVKLNVDRFDDDEL